MIKNLKENEKSVINNYYSRKDISLKRIKYKNSYLYEKSGNSITYSINVNKILLIKKIIKIIINNVINIIN